MKRKNLVWIGALLLVMLGGAGTIPVRAQDDGPVLLWDVQFDQNTAGPAFEISWSPDGTRLLVANKAFVKVLDAATGAELHTLNGYGYYAGMPDMFAQWSPDGSQILVWRVYAPFYDNGHFFVWDTTTGTLVRDWHTEIAYLRISTIWALPQRDVVVFDWDRSRSFYSTSTPPTADPLTLSVQGEVVSVALSPDGSTLATGVTLRAAYPVVVRFLTNIGLHVDSLPPIEGFMRVDLWDMASGEMVGSLSLPGLWNRLRLDWTGDGSGLLIQSAIDFNNGTSSPAWQIAADNDPVWLETGGYTTFTLWDVAADTVSMAVTEDYPYADYAMNAGDTQLVTWSRAPQITLWDVATGDSVHQFATPGAVSEVWWWPDAPHIVTLDFRPVAGDRDSYDVGWRVWDAETGDLLSERVFAAPYKFASPTVNRHKTRAAWMYACAYDTRDEDCTSEVMITDFAGNELYRIATGGWSYLTWNAAGDRLAMVNGFEPRLRIWAIPAAGE